MTRLHVYARLRRCSALAWCIAADLACDAALFAYSRSREADACAELYLERADASL